MIIRHSDGGLLVINQVEHASLASRLAGSWGNAQFARPKPFAEMVLAALSHDDGWTYRDRRPLVNHRTGRPYDFYELPMESVLETHRDSVRLTRAQPPYSAMMVSMHRTGLCQGRYGTEANWERRARDQLLSQVKKFVVREEAWQKRIRRRLFRDHNYGRVADDNHVWSNYKLIQLWDRLSLYVCGVDVGSELSPAPTKYGAADTGLVLVRRSKNRIRVKPWPFASQPLKVEVDTRLIRDRKYADSDELSEELFSSPVVSMRFELE